VPRFSEFYLIDSKIRFLKTAEDRRSDFNIFQPAPPPLPVAIHTPAMQHLGEVAETSRRNSWMEGTLFYPLAVLLNRENKPR
jgi:hypothetical protein